MAITTNTVAEQMGRAVADEVAERPSVSEIWVSPGPDWVHIYLLTSEIERDEEMSLYRPASILDTMFPDVMFQLHVMKPSNWRVPLREALPPDAIQIFPTAA